MRRSFRVTALFALALSGNLVGVAQAQSAAYIQVAPAFTAQQQLARRGMRGSPTLARLTDLPLPMLVAGSELDPPSFVPDTERLIAGRVASGKPTVPLHLPNHSHLSEAYAIGTADESLSAPILHFIQAPPR